MYLYYQQAHSDVPWTAGLPRPRFDADFPSIIALIPQDEISVAPGVTVKSLGLCGGDVIWVIGNVPDARPAAATQAPTLAKKPRSGERSGMIGYNIGGMRTCPN